MIAIKRRRALATAGILAGLISSSGSLAQVQFNVCGGPPLPPCDVQVQPKVEERIIERRSERRFGNICRTRYLRCELDDPQPVRSRCTCEDEDGEEVVGRVR